MLSRSTHYSSSIIAIRRRTAVAIICAGFLVGIWLNQYGFLFENIRVDLKLSLVDDGSKSPAVESAEIIVSDVDGKTRSSYVVPNIVHFFWFTDDDSGKRRMLFVEYMSILSVHRIQQPEEIQFHCSRLPDEDDMWWSRLWKETPLKIVYHDKPTILKQMRLTDDKQLCKLLAIKVLLDQGGIFINWNVLVVKNLNPLREHNVTFGKHSSSKSQLSTDVVAACRNATFLRILVDLPQMSVKPCNVDQSAYTLSLRHPGLLNVVRFRTPCKTCPPQPVEQRSSKTASDYVVQLSHDNGISWRESSPETIKLDNGTIGAAMRSIYYGSSSRELLLV